MNKNKDSSCGDIPEEKMEDDLMALKFDANEDLKKSFVITGVLIK